MYTAIYSLFQRHELAKAQCFIDQVVPALHARRHLHILINDEDSPELRAFAQDRCSHITVYCEGRNLGVAGGRNFLIRRAVAAGSEFLISCDTDIIYDAAYFERLEGAFQRLSKCDPKVGFLQPVLLDGRKVRQAFPALAEATDWTDLHARLDANPDSRVGLWDTVQRVLGQEAALSSIYHAGVSNLWRAHFGVPPDDRMPLPWSSPDWRATFRTDRDTLRSEPVELAQILADGEPARIGSVAGGVAAFHAQAFAALGHYDEIFNPFGYEDSEVGFRSQLAEQNNYLVPDAVAVHDLFMGEDNRTLLSHSRIGLLRGVEASHPALNEDAFKFAVQQSLVYPWRDLLKRFGDSIRKGQLAADAASNLVPDFIASYLFDFIRGALSGLGKPGRSGEAPPLLRLLRGFLEGDANLPDFQIPLGLGCQFVSGKAMTRIRIAPDGNPIYSFFASNCRIEEISPEGPLTSRYFDISIVVSEIEPDNFRTAIDVQSDDVGDRIEIVVERRHEGHVRDGSLHVRDLRCQRKAYEYGRFSVEEIYPTPSLHRSKAWLPAAHSFLSSIDRALGLSGVRKVLQAVGHYLELGGHANRELADADKSATTALGGSRKKRILVFTDSRGQHKPAGGEYPIFGERLAADERFEVDLILCPMKWTTTIDFLEYYTPEKLALYDHVILYTGIVDWSPRRLSSAISDLYDNPATANAENLALNTRDYSKKIVNNKKQCFDGVFGAEAMARHFVKPLETHFEGEATANMYGLEMARTSLIPRLNAIPNLIFISSNRFVPGWRGDYRRERPANISLTHAYSNLFSEALTKVKLIDLMQWSDEEVKKYTCDNLHLSQLGSDFIYERIMEVMEMTPHRRADTTSMSSASTPKMAGGFKAMRSPERITSSKKPGILSAANRTGVLATLVIGVRLGSGDEVRVSNLKFLLEWLDHYYGDLFDVLLVEQDQVTRVNLAELGARPYVRHEFLYNPKEYNRGWGYNVAIARFCDRSEVVALMDTDVLTGANFLREIIDCHGKYDAISPYQNIYYTDAKEAAELKRSKKLEALTDPRKIKNPVTVAGGILIVKRSVFLKLKGFEQYVGYGCEDRALDVTLYNHLDPRRIRIADEAYPHLHHDSDQAARSRFQGIYDHLVDNYGCKYDPKLGPFDFIHKYCNHVPLASTLKLMNERAASFGDPDLYRCGIELSINGTVARPAPVIDTRDVIYPPDFTTLDAYAAKELYAKTPEPDCAEIAALYNAFKGKRCFIIGNGPSLNQHDLSLLKDEYTFGVNSFFYKTRETGFRPYFYVVEDSSVMKENIEEIRSFDTPYKFFPTNYRTLHPKQPNTMFFRMNRGFYEKSSPNYVVPRFSTDASKVLYCGQSVTYINLQLAYFMGFSEVYLIGMDFSYVIPDSHKRTGDVLLSDSDDPNHFHKDYFGKGKTWKDPKLDRVALNYKQAKLVYEATGRTIYNATKGGSLEIFQRVDYDELLAGNGGGKAKAARAGSDSFAGANNLLRQGELAKALGMYVRLARSDQNLFLYKRAALDCYLAAVEKKVHCDVADVAYVRGLIVGLA